MPPSLASSELIDGQDIETLSPVPASPEPYCSLGVMQPNGDERLLDPDTSIPAMIDGVFVVLWWDPFMTLNGDAYT